MSTLAAELKARGITLVDPLVAAALKSKKAGVSFEDFEEDFCFDREEGLEVNTTPKQKKATPSKTARTPTPRKKAALKSPLIKSPPLKSPFKQVTPIMSSRSKSYGVDELTEDFSTQIIQGFVNEGMSSLQYGGQVDFGDGMSCPYILSEDGVKQ
jgi:hypothetical protein